MSTVHVLSIVLPFANEIAIVLTQSKLPLFSNLYRHCFHSGVHKCTRQDYINKVVIDLIAFLGILLFICKNAINYGYVTGVATGMVLIFCSIIFPTLFLGIMTKQATTFLGIKSPYLYIFVGMAIIIGLMFATNFLESIVQKLTYHFNRIDNEPS